MFNWLGNLFPYSDLHSLNLDWILTKMKETAAQAAKAIADSANALAQVIEAKTAAQNAQKAASNAQTAASNARTAANNAATSAENAVGVAQSAKTTAQSAQTTAQNAQTAAQNAQSTAQSAQSTAQSAQSTAQSAQSMAETAKSTAETAQTNVDTLNKKFPIKTPDIANNAVTTDKMYAKKCAISTVGGKTTGVFPAPLSDVATDISHITEELSPGTFGALLLDTAGLYFQPLIFFQKPNNGEAEDIQASFTPFHFDPDTSGHAEYTPFVIENLTKNKIMRGYARIRNADGVNYKFQMFFDEAPSFTAGYRFNIEIRSIGGFINYNF